MILVIQNYNFNFLQRLFENVKKWPSAHAAMLLIITE